MLTDLVTKSGKHSVDLDLDLANHSSKCDSIPYRSLRVSVSQLAGFRLRDSVSQVKCAPLTKPLRVWQDYVSELQGRLHGNQHRACDSCL